MRKLLIFLLSVFVFVCIAAGFPFYQFMQSKAYVHRPIVPQIPDPTETAEWQTLLDTYSNSPCLQDRTAAYLIEQALNLQLEVFKASGKEKVIVPDYYDSLERRLLEYIANFGDSKSAIRILPYIDNQSIVPRTRLLFLAGEYEDALKELRKSHKKYPDGSDYGAVWSLVTRGDYNKAIEVARIALQWRHPRSYISSHSIACISDYTNYPRAIGMLAHRLAREKRYTEALELKASLGHFVKNRYNGRGFDNCYRFAGRRAYMDAAYGIADIYIKNSHKKKALEIYQEIFFFEEEIANIRKQTLENEMQRQGVIEDAIKLGWLEDKDYLPYTPKQHCNAAQKDPIPSTAAEWREKLDTCGKNKKHRRYGIHITEKEQMLHCYMDTLETLQIQTVFKRLPWQC